MSDNINDFFSFEGLNKKDIPKIPLYMDQILGLFDDFLSFYKRDDKENILTKTMINNYVKSEVIAPPQKKKYEAHHLMMLALVYQLKNILSINDIQEFFRMYHIYKPSTEKKAKASFSKKDTEACFDDYKALGKTHLDSLFKRYSQNIVSSEDKEAIATDDHIRHFVATLLVEADLNKRLALLLMDEHSKDLDKDLSQITK